jgi:CheY-like chemotaxis protein
VGSRVDGGRRILVVDDEEDVRDLVSRVLQDAGFQVNVAAGGREAIARMASEHPDLLILDIMMPDVDGWAVLAHVADMQTPPPVVVLSGGADYDVIQRATGQGAKAVLAKPFRFHELVAICHGVLAQEHAGTPPEGAPARTSPRRVIIVQVTVLSAAAAPFFVGTLVNLSRGGAQLEVEVSLEIGAQVRVAFGDSGKDAPLSIDGRVHWRSTGSRGYTYGLGFEDLRVEQQERLRDLLDHDAEDG